MNQSAEFNQITWHVLNKIKSHLTDAKPGSFVKYIIQLLPINNREISLQNEFEVFRYLDKWKAIQIYRRELSEKNYVILHLNAIEPTFNQVYKMIEQTQPELETMDSVQTEQSELTFNYKSSFKYFDLKQEKIHFSRFYLKREIENFEANLKHFFETGAIDSEDFTLLSMNSKMIKKFLERGISVKEKRKVKPHKRPLNSKQLPLPITGEIIVTGLTESLKALGNKSPLYNGPKFPYKIPAGTHWNNVIIKFLDDERIEIHVKKLKFITDYKEMGMIGRGKVPTPNEQWLFLKVLAKCYGELSFKDPEAKDKYKKQKQILANTLQNYFSIDFDPFYPYHSSSEKAGNSYKIKILLLPQSKNNEYKESKYENDPDTLGIQEFLNEEAPQVVGI